MLGNYLQQTTSADDIFICIFLGVLRVKLKKDGSCITFKSETVLTNIFYAKKKLTPQQL